MIKCILLHTGEIPCMRVIEWQYLLPAGLSLNPYSVCPIGFGF